MKIAQCGTDSGYYRHRRVLKDQPCYPCTRAHAAAERERSIRGKATVWVLRGGVWRAEEAP